jgi:hypothetical protein
MDICSARRHLSLNILLLICASTWGCTQAAYARIRFSQIQNPSITIADIESVIASLGWVRDGGVYRAATEPSLYLRLEKNAAETIQLTFVIVGATTFRVEDIRIYLNLAELMVKKYGGAVDYDKKSSAGQAMA